MILYIFDQRKIGWIFTSNPWIEGKIFLSNICVEIAVCWKSSLIQL